MSKWTFTQDVVALAVVIVLLSSCAPSSGQIASGQAIDQATSTMPAPDVTRSCAGSVFVDRAKFGSLQELFAMSEVIIEGTIRHENTRTVPDDTATNAELAERKALGASTDRLIIDYEVTVDKVLKGAADAATITVFPGGSRAEYEILPPGENSSFLHVGDRDILFLREYSDPSLKTSGPTTYAALAPEGQFRVEKDNTISSYIPKSCEPVVDLYRGKDKSVLEQDIQELVAESPKPTKADVLQETLKSTGIVVEGTIQGVRGVHFVNSLEKSQQEIDQLLAEGKMPGLVLTDYAIMVDKVLYDMRGDHPKFFPDWKPLEPGEIIIVTRQGGTYRGVTKVEEPGPAFEVGNREVLFLSGFSLKNYDLPDDGQVRYSTDSRLGRLLIGSDGQLAAFTTRGVGGLFGGQSLEQLEKDLAEFVKSHPSN